MGRRKRTPEEQEAAAELKAAKKAAKNGGAKAGHNSTLTDDERRALTLHHKKAYEAADALVEKAKSDRKSVTDLAKSDLGKGAVADIKELIADSDEVKVKAKIERALRLARWAGLPVGTEVNLFDAPVDDRAAQEGMTAGMAGEPCTVPQHYSGEASQRYIASWHAGQAVLASAFGKKRGTTEPKQESAEAAAAAPTPVEQPQPEAAPAAA